MSTYKTLSALGLAAILGASAVQHVRNPESYFFVVPWSLSTDKGGRFGIMTRRDWVKYSAVVEAAAALGLALPATRKLTATVTAGMFVAFTAGHVSALQHSLGPEGKPAQKRFNLIRLPLQLPLIAWAWSIRRP